MADNPIKYSDLLQADDSIQKAIQELKELNEAYTKVLSDTKKEAISLKATIKSASGATEEQREKIRTAATEVDRLAKAQKAYEYAASESGKELARLNALTAEHNRLNKLEVQMNEAMEGSYNRLAAQYSLNVIKLNKMSQEWRETTAEGKAFVAETNKIYQNMIKMNEAVGKHQLSVGNYAKGLDGLKMSMSQVVRESPALAINTQTFFLAISNNIPILIDEINKLKAANAAAAAQGQATTPVWKDVAKALLSWNTVMMLGITVVVMFGKQIGEWISGMFKSKEAVDLNKKAMEQLAEVNKKGGEDAQKDLTRLKLLYNATQDTTKSINERKKAVDALQKKFPAYFKNMDDEAILAGKAADKYNSLSTAIIKSAMSRAAEEKLVENNKQLLDLYGKRADKQREVIKQEAILAKRSTAAAKAPAYGGYAAAADPTLGIQAKRVESLKGQKKEMDDQIKSIEATNKRLVGMIDVSALDFSAAEPEQKNKREKKVRDDLDLVKKALESEVDIMKDGEEKKTAAAMQAYNFRKLELETQLKNDKDLTQQGREAINVMLKNLDRQLNKDLGDIAIQGRKDRFAKEAEQLQLQLEMTKEGTEEEMKAKVAILENARSKELFENSLMQKNLRQSELDINAKYNSIILKEQADFYTNIAMLRFDQYQDLEESEFALLRKTEGEKTRFKLQQEKERLQKILDINKTANTQMTAEQVQTVKNQIAKIDKDIKKSATEERTKDIYSLVGLKLNDKEKQGIDDATSFAIGQVNAFMDAKVEAANRAVEASNKEVDAAKGRLNSEIEARNQGYASNVSLAQKELDMAKRNQEKALKEQERAQKAQARLQTIMQVGDLVTASAKIWGQLGFPWAIPALAVMWGSFALAKVKASQVTKQQYGEGGLEFLEGGSHASGNDIPLGNTKGGKRRTAEGGEALAIIRKSKTRKYKGILPSIVDSLNKGTFEQKFMGAFNNDGMSLSVVGGGSDMSKLEGDVREIRKQGERKTYTDAAGRTVETYKNLRRIIK